MTDLSFVSLGYHVEIEWVLSWFPVRDGAIIDRPIMRNGTIRHGSASLGAGQSEVHWLGEAEGLPPGGGAAGFATVYGDLDGQLSVQFEGRLGTKSARLLLPAPPSQRVPFMLNISRGRDRSTDGTALSLFGTVTTGSRFRLEAITAKSVQP